jgi:site-specific recombinase XerD
VTSDEIEAYVAEFLMASRARQLSGHTITSYADGLGQLVQFLHEQSITTIEDIDRPVIEKWLIRISESHAPGTVTTRFRTARRFFNWLVLEEEIDRSPMATMSEPKGEQKAPRMPADKELSAVLAAIAGKSFKARRDAALIRFMADTGCRAREVVGLTLDDVDVEGGTALVMGKGSKQRIVAFGPKTSQALLAYLRARRKHPHNRESAFWLTRFGAMRYGSLHDVVRDRGAAVGIKLSPHALRHRFAHSWMSKGGAEADLAALGGWSSKQVMARYGRSVAAERAREAHRRLGPSEDL